MQVYGKLIRSNEPLMSPFVRAVDEHVPKNGKKLAPKDNRRAMYSICSLHIGEKRVEHSG